MGGAGVEMKSQRWGPQDGVRRDQRARCSVTPSTVGGHSEMLDNSQPGGALSLGTWTASTLTLDVQPPELPEVNVCHLRPLSVVFYSSSSS